MKIINQSRKHKAPDEIFTDLIAKCWGEVGMLKAQIEGFNREFNDTGKVCKVLEDLVDSYLICIGQLQDCLEKRDIAPITQKQLKQGLSDEETMKKLTDLLIDEREAISGYTDVIYELEDESETKKTLKHINDEELQHIDELTNLLSKEGEQAEYHFEDEQEQCEGDECKKIADKAPEAFQYYVEFDEPAQIMTAAEKAEIKEGLKATWRR